MIRVVVFISAKPGCRDELLTALRANLPAVRAEQGCIEYGPVEDVPGFGAPQTPIGPDSYVILEAWESAQALKAHIASPHMAAYAEKTKHLIASRAIHILTPM
ncbi:MAG: putative quinol monooxygenase [Roseiarcus sp.]